MASTPVSVQLARMGYAKARALLMLAGLAILGVLLAVLLMRSVDTTEVIGTLLFAPVFVLLLAFGLVGGLVGAAGATIVYVLLRADAIDAVGFGEFSGLVVARGIAYLLFGAVGGWASGTLAKSLDKLDLYDQIDDLTGVNNARFLLHDVDLERARSERYQTVFSVSFVEIDAAALDELSGRRRRALLRELGRRLADGVRSMDRVAHGYDGDAHRIATILPETAGEGARVFHDRLIQGMRTFLVDNGVAGSVRVEGTTCTVPGADDALAAQLEVWRRIDAAEHASL